MTRGKWKPNFFLRVESFGSKIGLKIKVNNRSLVIISDYEGIDFLVHSGKNYGNVLCNEKKFLHKLGEFVLTRRLISEEKKKKLELKKNKFRLKKKKK